MKNSMALTDDDLRRISDEVEDEFEEEASDDVYMTFIENVRCGYQELCMERLKQCIREYKREKKRNPFGFSLEYMTNVQGRWLKRLVMSGFTVGCHRMVSTEERVMEEYRRDVSYKGQMMIDEEFMDVYAYYRRFYDCVGGRYSLKDELSLAKHLYLNRDVIRESVLEDFMTDVYMMRIVQFDIDDMLCDDEYKLSGISGYDPYAVLDYVDRLKGFAKKDVRVIRLMWVRMMVRGDEILRKMDNKKDYVNAFVTRMKNDEFNKKVVCGIIGVMCEMGVYDGRWSDMSRALEEREQLQVTRAKSMENKFAELGLTMGAKRLIVDTITRLMG